jgi:hypothetical protein
LALLFALRAVALGVWLRQPLSTALGLAAVVPHLLALLIVSSAASLSLPRRFELKLGAQLVLLLVAGLAWAVGQGFGALAHGPGRHDQLELPVVLLVVGHVGLSAWLAGVIKSNAFEHPPFVSRAKRALLSLSLAGCIALALSFR